MAVLDQDRHLLAARPGLLLIADKGYASAELDSYLDHHGVELVRPATATARPVPASGCSPRSASSSNQSTTPSKANSTWNCTAGAALPGSPPASPSGCRRSPPRSGTTTPPAHSSKSQHTRSQHTRSQHTRSQ